MQAAATAKLFSPSFFKPQTPDDAPCKDMSPSLHHSPFTSIRTRTDDRRRDVYIVVTISSHPYIVMVKTKELRHDRREKHGDSSGRPTREHRLRTRRPEPRSHRPASRRRRAEVGDGAQHMMPRDAQIPL